MAAENAETAENTTTTTTTTNTSAAPEAASSASASASSVAATTTTEKPEPELKSDVSNSCSLFSYLFSFVVDNWKKRDHHQNRDDIARARYVLFRVY